MQAVRGDCARERNVDDAGFDDREAILRVDRENAREAIESDEHAAVGERSAGEAGARAARNERETAARELAHHRDHFIARSRKHREPRPLVIRRQRVRGVRQQFARPKQHASRTDDLGEAVGEGLVDRLRGREGSGCGHARKLRGDDAQTTGDVTVMQRGSERDELSVDRRDA